MSWMLGPSRVRKSTYPTSQTTSNISEFANSYYPQCEIMKVNPFDVVREQVNHVPFIFVFSGAKPWKKKWIIA